MATSEIIVCEQRGRWAERLRYSLSGEPVRLRQTRRLVDCYAEVAQSPASLVLLEWLAARRAELAEFVDRLTRRYGQTAVVALAERAVAGDELLAREAGVIHFGLSRQGLRSVARLVRRHTFTATQPAEPLARLLAGPLDISLEGLAPWPKR